MEGKEERIAGFGDSSSDHDAGGIEEHDAGFEGSGHVDYIAFDEGWFLHEFAGRGAVIAFEPKAAAHAFETAVRSAEAGRAVGSDVDVADFAGPGIGSADELAVDEEAASDSG